MQKMGKAAYMFRSDENEKEEYEIVREECLALIDALQITYICVFLLFQKDELPDDKIFEQKKYFRQIYFLTRVYSKV